MPHAKAKTLAVIASIWTLASSGPASAQSIQSRYTALDNDACRIVESGEPLGQDWLLHRCDGADGIAVWMLYQDSARLQIGLGEMDFETRYRPWSHERDATWPVEWRGRSGAPPFAAIVRATPLGDSIQREPSRLAVFRVWPDRPVCFLGAVETNAEARQLADRSQTVTTCPGD